MDLGIDLDTRLTVLFALLAAAGITLRMGSKADAKGLTQRPRSHVTGIQAKYDI